MRRGCALIDPLRHVSSALLACLPLCLALSAAAAADDTFPYRAYTISDGVYVRSGPGKNYYPTDKLGRGTEVEIYRHDPGGWYAIRPPQGSFAWIAARNLRPLADRPTIAEVIGDHVSALVGSRFSDVHDVCQVHLDRGEQVEVLGQKRFVAEGNAATETWYRIAPPRGEFRWVSGRFVARDGQIAGREGQVSASATADNSSAAATERAAIAAESRPAPTGLPASPVQSASFVEEVAPPAVQLAAATEPAAGPATDARGREVVALPIPGTVHAPAGAAPTAFQNELDDIDLKLSMMIVEEPTAWQFDALKTRANSVAASARTALERGRAHEMLRAIQQYETIRRQYVDLSALRQQTDRQNANLAQAVSAAAASVANPAAELAKFDGVGRLTPVVSRRSGAPRYALTDASGSVVTFVTPGAELSLQPYVGKVVGLTGSRGFMPQLNKPHLTAQRITALDPSVLR